MLKWRVGTLEMILQRTTPALDFMPFCERVARGVLERFSYYYSDIHPLKKSCLRYTKPTVLTRHHGDIHPFNGLPGCHRIHLNSHVLEVNWGGIFS
jgi:hypothetical protein